MCSVDSNGLQGIMLSMHNPLVENFVPYLTCGGIILDMDTKCFSQNLRVLNLYGPYQNKPGFLDDIVQPSILKDPCLIITRDFNFTISVRDIRGSHARLYPLSYYFFGII